MHPNTDPCDQVKTLKNMFEPDPRTRFLDLGIEDYLSLVAEAKLVEAVPSEIRIQFDVARNIFIFSYYSYQMAMAAQMQAFATLELARMRRLANSSVEYKKQRPSLSELFQIALDNDWINDKALTPGSVDLERYPEDDKFWCKALRSYWAPSTEMRRQFNYQGRRNQIVHEPGTLDLPHETAEMLRKCACLIDHLFLIRQGGKDEF